MQWIDDDNKIPIYSWVECLENGAYKQAVDLTSLPFVFHHVSLMPDCLTDDTDILTQTGFKKIVDLKYDDFIFNYNQNTKKVFLSKPKNIVIRDLKP